MRQFIYVCPQTNLEQQVLVEEELIGQNTVWVPMDCGSCQRPHLINLAECISKDPPGDGIDKTKRPRGICERCGAAMTYVGKLPRVGARAQLIVCRCDNCKRIVSGEVD